MARSNFLALAVVGVALFGSGSEAWARKTPQSRGHVLAERICGACHAVARDQTSRDPKAPAFASVEMQHTAGLEGRLNDLTRLGHKGMPPLTLKAAEVQDLLAYIDSLHTR